MPRRCSSTYSAAARRGVVRGASRRSGSGRGLPAERLSGFAHMSRPRYADDSPARLAAGEVCPYHRIVNLSRDLRYRVTADCYDPAQIVPDADVYPAARAGVVLQEAASRLPSAAAFASGTFGQRGGRPIRSTSSIPSRGACWWRPSRSKARRRVWSSRPYTVTATPCYTGISTTIISARRPSNTRYPSVPLPARTG